MNILTATFKSKFEKYPLGSQCKNLESIVIEKLYTNNLVWYLLEY
jgi:hypothetical protein